MFFDPACIPCIIKQAYNAAKLFSDGNKEAQLNIIKEVCTEVIKLNGDSGAPRFSRTIQSIIEQYSGTEDPYKEIKEKNIGNTKSRIPFIESMIEEENKAGRLEVAVRAAIMGNVIDYGAKPDFDIEYEINRLLSGNVDLHILKKFTDDCYKADTILYIADNYEEALFDKLLIKELLPKNIVFAVRSKPILNDITLEGAGKLGIDKICPVIESGSTIAGTDLNECSDEFMKLFKEADVVIAKGQGNYESLIKEERPIYFMFKVKCGVISEKCGNPVGSGVLLLNTDGYTERKLTDEVNTFLK
jgi:uncharacterized protein with ATP-grasp and redox domains